jgi:hypothetical protein
MMHMMTYPTPIDSNSTLENGGGVPTPKKPFWDNSPYELLTDSEIPG